MKVTRFIRNPRATKVARYETAQHEAGHCIARSVFGGAAIAYVYRSGRGICIARGPCRALTPREEAIIAAAGDAAFVLYLGGSGSIPRGRWRGSRVPRVDFDTIKCDAKRIADECRFTELVYKTEGTGKPLDPEEVRDAAVGIILDNFAVMQQLAFQLYRRGWASIGPAKQPTRQPSSADVLPGK